MAAAVRKKKVRDSMNDWISLNKVISNFTEDEVIYALELENRRQYPRKTFVKRLAQRLHSVRAEEIKKEIYR